MASGAPTDVSSHSSVDPRGEESRASGMTLAQLLETHRAALEEEGLELLRKLLRIDTQNHVEEGTEMEAVLLLKETFETAGVAYEIVEPKPGRGNIVARVPGDGTTGKGAVLLSAHLDTVHAPRENWQDEGWRCDPYGAETLLDADGHTYLYGRGAIDMKHMAAMAVVVLCFVKRNNVRLGRDLIFAGLADEERSDSTYGVKYLVENRPELVEADVVLNEVGGFSAYLAGKEFFPIQVAEKGSNQLRITAHGSGGHGSLYHSDNPIAKIGEVASTLASTRLPIRYVPANVAFVNSMADLVPFPKSFVFRRVLSPWLADIILDRLVPPELINAISPLLRNTANPTIISGGQHPNQIPTSAWVHVDSRTLPDCSLEDALDDIKGVLGRENFELKPGPEGEELPPDFSIEVLKTRITTCPDLDDPRASEALDVIQEVIESRADGARILPTLIPGGTDSYFYVQNPLKKPVCLGFTPLRLPEGLVFSALFHGTNERIPIYGFKWGITVLAEVVFKLCSAELA